MAESMLSIEVNLAGAKPSSTEFLLVMVNGTEGVSIPYSYDVTLFRPKTKPDINPKLIINTVATIRIDTSDPKNLVRFFRTGVFEHFEKAGTGTKNDDFRVYTGRIVPAFKMLDREVLFRVFENQNVVTILDTVLKGVPNLLINISALRSAALKFPKMEYCVQFGESTFAFVLRLLARFGIHYFFDHRGSPDEPQNDTMIFGEGPELFEECLQDTVDIVADKDSDEKNVVAGFVQRFEPVFRSTKAGNFNVLAPTKPFTSTKAIDPGFDLANQTSGPARDFKREEFPGSFSSQDGAQAYSDHGQKQEETKVASIIGRGKNPTFIPGRTIFIRNDAIHVAEDGSQAGSLKGKKFLLTWVCFSALEPGGARSFWTDVGDFLSDLFRGASGLDITAGIVSGGLNNYLQNEQQALWSKAFEIGPSGGFPLAVPFMLAGGVGNIAGVLGSIIPAITNLRKLNAASFSNTFVATGTQGPLTLPPQPASPFAHGPHLATVIGDDGADASKGDISADALGRVRVRFPWDPGPAKPGAAPGDPFTTGGNTCWVRVAQSWAGRSFGAQFLPRIGNEVVVEFIDGDPERPIITGSVYNADRGVPNLPFAAFKEGAKPFSADDLFAHTELSSFQRSGIKTSVSPPASSGKQGFHLLRFDDTRGSEQLLVRSQGRYDLTAFHSQFETTHGDRHVLVKAGHDEKGKAFGGGTFTSAGGEYDLHVAGDRYEGVDKAAQLTVKGDAVFDLQGNCTTIVGKTATVNATKITLEAQSKITLKVGGSFVVVDPCGVFISGPRVQINSGGSPDSTSDAELTDPADAAQADPGDPDNFLDLQPKGGGGGRRHHTAHAKHGFVCTANADGTIQVTKAIRVDATDPNYADAVIADLSLMNTTKKGQALLTDLDSAGKSVLVRKLVPPPNPPNAFATPTNGTTASNGTGSDSTVDYNPDQWPDPSTRTKAPGDVLLFHELTHADHNSRGTNDTATTRTDNFDNNEEFNTIGPENEYRDERGVPRRTDHHDL